MGIADTSDTSDTSATSSVAGTVGALPVVRPVGTSPSLCKVGDEPTYRGNLWPPADVQLALPPDVLANRTWSNAPPPNLGFLGRGWTTPWSSWVLLTSFAQSDEWYKNVPLEKALTAQLPADATDDLQQLTELIEFRSGVLSEALAQRTGLATWFGGVLTFGAGTHPATYLLATTAEMIGNFVVMYWKAKFARPRPSRLSPALMPPIEVPGHASFPSGHATQSALVAWTLAQVMPQAAWAIADADWKPDCDYEGSDLPDPSLLPAGPLFRLAQRIGRNREVLGLHYPSDSAAGRILAAETFRQFTARLPLVAPAAGGDVAAVSLWDLARAEWQVPNDLNPPQPPALP